MPAPALAARVWPEMGWPVSSTLAHDKIDLRHSSFLIRVGLLAAMDYFWKERVHNSFREFVYLSM